MDETNITPAKNKLVINVDFFIVIHPLSVRWISNLHEAYIKKLKCNHHDNAVVILSFKTMYYIYKDLLVSLII